MEEKAINENGNFEIISQMIRRTQQRLQLGQGNQILLWGYVFLIVTVLIFLTGISGLRSVLMLGGVWLWFLIPIVGCVLSRMLRNKKIKEGYTPSYTDRLTSGLWRYIAWLCMAGALFCILFNSVFGIGASIVWWCEYIFALMSVGVGIGLQGLILRERSLIIGGIIGIASALGLLWVFMFAKSYMGIILYPVFFISSVTMLIIPGYIINRKAEKENERA